MLYTMEWLSLTHTPHIHVYTRVKHVCTRVNYEFVKNLSWSLFFRYIKVNRHALPDGMVIFNPHTTHTRVHTCVTCVHTYVTRVHTCVTRVHTRKLRIRKEFQFLTRSPNFALPGNCLGQNGALLDTPTISRPVQLFQTPKKTPKARFSRNKL